MLRFAFVLVASALASAIGPQPVLAADIRPNVLFVIADDLSPRLSCYGDPAASTPQIDRLAQRGVLFTRAYSQYPSCGPSRASMLSGRYPHEGPREDVDTWDIRSVYPDIVTLPQLFRQSGYFSARVGKIYHMGVPTDVGKPGRDDPHSWDVTINPTGWDAREENLAKRHRHGDSTGAGVGLSWLDPDIPDTEMADGAVASEAIRLMGEHHPSKTGKPLFLAVGFYRPHPPMIAPARHFAAIPPETIRLPPASRAERKTVPLSTFHFFRGEFNFVPESYGRDYARAYHASVHLVDTLFGQILDALEEHGLADNTIIVFTGDQGFHLGEHGHWHKTSLFEEGCRVPLILSAPGVKMAGRKSDALTGLIDLYPTLCDLADIQPPHRLSGRSLRPQLHDVDAPGKPAELTTMFLRGGGYGHSVRTDRYRYSLFQGGIGGAMLYDHREDPAEQRNVVTDPEYQGTVQRMRQIMRSMVPSSVLDQPEARIRAVMEAQEQAWNRGDLEEFVTYYEDAADTTFIGSEVVRGGHEAILGRYRRAYGQREKMGELRFADIRVRMLTESLAIVTGEYHLTRSAAGGGDANGRYSLVVRRHGDSWKIAHDHTTAAAR